MKKVFTTSLILLISGMSIVFAGGSTEDANSSQKVEISMAYPVAVDAPIAQMMNGYAEAFMAAHPDITVKMVYSGGYTDVKTAVQTAIQGNAKAPELAVMLAADIYDLINANYVESFDLNSVSGAKAMVDDILPSFMSNSHYDGKLYGIPFQRSDVVLYYNKDLFAQAGLSAPTDWKELAADAKALTVDGGKTRWGIEIPTDWPYWIFQPLAIGAGSNIFSDDLHVNFNDPAIVDAIRYYNSLSADYGATAPGVQASWGSSTQNFTAGKTAMIIHSSGSLTSILKSSNFNVGVMAVPGKEPGTYASVPGGGNIYLTPGHTAAENEAALQFVEFLLDPSRVADFSMATGYIPYRKATIDSAEWKSYVAKVPQAAEVFDAMNYAEAEFSTQALAQVRTVFHKYLQAAFNGKMDAQAAMDEAQKESEAILADYQ